jgi:hypothetical protein
MSLLKVYALIALVISSLFSAPSYGEDWQRVSVDSGLNKIYFDADSFELNEDGVAVWIMVDFATSVMGVLSRKSHVQMNCALGTFRLNRQVLYEEGFGSGQSYVTDVKSAFMSKATSNPTVAVVMDRVCMFKP